MLIVVTLFVTFSEDKHDQQRKKKTKLIENAGGVLAARPATDLQG